MANKTYVPDFMSLKIKEFYKILCEALVKIIVKEVKFLSSWNLPLEAKV